MVGTATAKGKQRLPASQPASQPGSNASLPEHDWSLGVPHPPSPTNKGLETVHSKQQSSCQYVVSCCAACCHHHH